VLLRPLHRPHVLLPATERNAAIASFAQWRVAVAGGDLRRVTWVAGDQPVLIEEVIDTTKRLLAPADGDYISLSHSPTFDRDVWAEANQYSLNPGANRMILIRDAHKLTRWQQLDLWLSRTRALPGVYLVFVSGEPDLPYANASKRTLKPHVEKLRAPRGYLVRCTMPAEADAIAWIRSRSRLDEETARHLLTRTGGNLAACAAVTSKLSLFSTAAGTAVIDALSKETPAADFTDNLIALNKRQALLALDRTSTEDHLRMIALLDSRLDLLAKLHRIQAAGQSWREASGINPYLQRQYLPYARHYDPTACSHRRRILTLVDDVLRTGARVGVLESLVALW
jgi:DNA polymerase III delta subunit